MNDASATPDVTIVGAGMAGMTAALRLLEAGFSVKVIEASSGIGGKFGARFMGQEFNDFAWHVFARWCRNFWDISRTIGLSEEKDFAERPTLTLLRPLTSDSRWRRAASVSYVGSPEFFWRNINSGAADWSDLVLFTYSLYSLLCDQSLENEQFLNRVTVNGYMRSLPYMSQIAALLHNELLLRIWAIPSYLISARAYQTYLQLIAPFTYPASPVVVLKRNFEDGFWVPFREALGRFGPRFTLVTGERLMGIHLADGNRVDHIVVAPSGASGERVEPVRRLIVAIPPDRLYAVLTNPASEGLRRVAAELLDVEKLPRQQTSTVTLHFKRRMQFDGVSEQPVALIDAFEDFYDPALLSQRNGLGSAYGLSFLDISRLRDGAPPTILSVLASDADALRGLDDDEAFRRILDELRRYLRFTDADIDWSRTVFQAHRDEKLFVNAVGTWEYRPEVRLTDSDGVPLHGQIWEKVNNLYLAGDYCRSQIDIVSLEGAAHTGIWAARALSAMEVAAGARGRRIVDPPLPRLPWSERHSRQLTGRLESWAVVAARRSRAVTAKMQAESTARHARPATPHSGPLARTQGEQPMNPSLSTFPGFEFPSAANHSSDDTTWLGKHVGAAASVTLNSGAAIPLPLLFWEARALVLWGSADADAVDTRVLQAYGLRAERFDDSLTPSSSGRRALVQIWAPDYGGVAVGPIKATFGSILVRPRQSCPQEHRDANMAHIWWWWYYGNSVLNQEFKAQTWGVPNHLGMVETTYRGDTKKVRLLENGRVALALTLGSRNVLGWSLVGGDGGRVPTERDRDQALATQSQAIARGSSAPFRFITVARRRSDDGENEVELLGARMVVEKRNAGGGRGSYEPLRDGLEFIPFDRSLGDDLYCGAGTAVEKQLEMVHFKPVQWEFLGTYNGVVKIYDRHGAATLPEAPAAPALDKIVNRLDQIVDALKGKSSGEALGDPD